jgi:CubicO group peptidase (beta-lactamase class C family)
MSSGTVIGLIAVFGLTLIFPAGTGQNEQRVDQIFAAYDNASSPGCALGVMKDDKFVYARGFGMASLELGVPISTQSVFYMGSIAKQFTATAVVLAAEQGLLSLDDDVRKYIPELPDYGHAITLRQMLHHTSGLRDFLSLLYLSGRHFEDIHSKEEILDLIVRQKGLNHTPGDAFTYSNTNYFLLGEVVRRVTKKSLAEFSVENIFQPLGMTHTRFYDDRTFVMPGRVAAYDPGSNGSFLVDWSTNYDTVGGGGLMSSIDDLAAWDKNFYRNKLGKGTLLNELRTRGVLNSGKQISYALGLGLGSYRGLPIEEHDGANFGYRAVILRFPEQHFTIACLCNISSADVSNLARRVADVYLEGSLEPEASSLQASDSGFPDASRFAGKYLDPRKHFVYTVTASKGKLAAGGANLRRVGANQFKDSDAETVTFDASDGDVRATVEMDGEVVFAGKRIVEPHLSEAELAAYAGRYKSAEIDAIYDLSIDREGLKLRNTWNPPLKLIPVAQDEFSSDELGTLVFHRDATRRISGLSIFSGNTLDIVFQKAN